MDLLEVRHLVRPAQQNPTAQAQMEGRLFTVESGVVSLQTERGLWVIPPGHVGWVPSMHVHGMVVHGKMRGLQLNFSQQWSQAQMPAEPKVVKLTPLLQGLLTEMPLGENGLYLQVFADAFERKPLPTLFLPMPSDPRLLAMTTSLVQYPANDADLDAWANDTGIPRRTLTRRFFKETGLSFAQWRQQMRLLLALEQLADGEMLTTVAQKVGYQSVSAFIQVFRRALGTTPKAIFP
jgi:AraC-like DNA-binding protein